MSTDDDSAERIVLSETVVRRLHAFEAARRELPEVDLSFDEFCNHLDALGYRTELPNHVAAVYLCGACALQRPTGLRTLDHIYFPALKEIIGRARIAADVVDDLLQTVRERLLVEPKLRIATYRGNGPLSAWLGVIASNAVRDRARCKRETRSLEEASWSSNLAERADVESPEWVSLSRESSGLIEMALQRAIRGLELQQRRLLELHFLHGLGIDDLAPLIGVHRSSAARRIKRIVQTIADTVQKQLRIHGALLDAFEFEGLVPGLCCSGRMDLAMLLSSREGSGAEG